MRGVVPYCALRFGFAPALKEAPEDLHAPSHVQGRGPPGIRRVHVHPALQRELHASQVAFPRRPDQRLRAGLGRSDQAPVGVVDQPRHLAVDVPRIGRADEGLGSRFPQGRDPPGKQGFNYSLVAAHGCRRQSRWSSFSAWLKCRVWEHVWVHRRGVSGERTPASPSNERSGISGAPKMRYSSPTSKG